MFFLQQDSSNYYLHFCTINSEYEMMNMFVRSLLQVAFTYISVELE